MITKTLFRLFNYSEFVWVGPQKKSSIKQTTRLYKVDGRMLPIKISEILNEVELCSIMTKAT